MAQKNAWNKYKKDEIKEVLGNEYQDYNLERYQQTAVEIKKRCERK